jgi:hypothetical protein
MASHRSAAAACGRRHTPAAPPPTRSAERGRARAGVVVERTERVVIETGPGRVTFRLASSSGSSKGGLPSRPTGSERPSSPWRRRRLGDARALGRRAGIPTQSQGGLAQALAADPSHPEANEALGRVQLDGAWVAEDEAYRARGYVPFDGRWVTPAEHEAFVRERAAADAPRGSGARPS